MYLCDYMHRSEVLSHLHGNKVKQSPLINQWPISVFENLKGHCHATWQFIKSQKVSSDQLNFKTNE